VQRQAVQGGMARRAGGRGFWAGFLTGLVIVVLAALALAWIYPPLQPPVVDEGMLEPPAAPGTPDNAAAPGPLLTPAPGPVVEGLPSLEEPPEDGAAPGAGSPSLVPAEDR
jgi:hypothetical protein